MIHTLDDGNYEMTHDARTTASCGLPSLPQALCGHLACRVAEVILWRNNASLQLMYDLIAKAYTPA